MGDPQNKQRFNEAHDRVINGVAAMAAEFDLAFDGTPTPVPPTPTPTPTPEPTPTPTPTPAPTPPPTPEDEMAKPADIENGQSRHSFEVDPNGHMWEDYGDKLESSVDLTVALDAGFEPNAAVSAARTFAGIPRDNPFFTWYTVSARKGGGGGMVHLSWEGDRAAGLKSPPANHWVVTVTNH